MRIKITAAAIACALMLSSCAQTEKNAEKGQMTEISGGSDIAAEETTDFGDNAEPFSEYAFELRGADEKYVAIVRRGAQENEISISIENNMYESTEFIITPPDGYNAYFPFDQRNASSVVNVINNDIDETYIPDIMQFTFYAGDNGAENEMQSVSSMYMISKEGALKKIPIYYVADEEKAFDFLDRNQLYHSEPDKFIYEIIVDDTNIYDEYGNPRPVSERIKIKTMTFDYKTPRFVIGYEEISEDNPLYFGYAYWSAANSAASYFTMTSLNVSDYEHYIEMPSSGDSSYTDYFFKIDDSRFENTQDLKKYLETIFLPAAAERLFNEAPQKYRDIDGELYGIVGDGSYDTSLGTLTFSGMEISENRMTFRSRQEKYDEFGRFNGYTDGGSFVITKDDNGVWKVSVYRFPYS